MRDAMGGTVTITIIVVFIVIALGYMAFNVNYTKAFRMKDKIVSLYDDYKGECFDECQDKIKAYATEIGYDSGAGTGATIGCPTDYDSAGNLYCYHKVTSSINKSTFNNDVVHEEYYYEIVTRINVDVPIIKNVLPSLRLFNIYGSTKTYVKE